MATTIFLTADMPQMII